MTQIYIQLQDESGVWRTYHITNDNLQKIVIEMVSLQRQNPKKRVRAISKDGRLVDMLG